MLSLAGWHPMVVTRASVDLPAQSVLLGPVLPYSPLQFQHVHMHRDVVALAL